MAQKLFFILLVLRDHWNVKRESALLARAVATEDKTTFSGDN